MKTDGQILEYFENELAGIAMPQTVKQLYEPIEYTLAPGGKRLRPLLCLRSCEAAGANASTAINQAMAVEMFHNFTLIHDDVMDKSDTRRGRPTVFAKWGSTQAILSGDALLTLATAKAAEVSDPAFIKPVLEMFNKTALEVYEGQQLDMDFEERTDVTADEYMEMIRLKTSVLLGCACSLGVMSAGGREALSKALYGYGVKLGLAFQLRDDWLDSFGSQEEFGKPIGGDIANRKKTWLFITACSEAPSAMAKALEKPGHGAVAEVISVYKSLKLEERCDAMVGRYCQEAIESLESVDIPREYVEWFAQLAQNLCHRSK